MMTNGKAITSHPPCTHPFPPTRSSKKKAPSANDALSSTLVERSGTPLSCLLVRAKPPTRGGSPPSPWSPGMWRRNSLVDRLGSCGWQPTLSARNRRTKARFVAEMQRAHARWSSPAMERRCVEGSTSDAARGGTQRSASEGRNGRKSDVLERNGRGRG